MATTIINSKTVDKSIVECTPGAEYLLDIKAEREIPLEKGEEWLKIIQEKYPHIPKALLWSAIDLYTLNPQRLDSIVADCQANSDKYKEEKKVRFADEKFNQAALEILSTV